MLRIFLSVVFYSLTLGGFPHLAEGACTVQIETCQLGAERDSCIKDEQNESNFICSWNNETVGDEEDPRNMAWALCNGGCFDQDGGPIIFTSEMSQYFCKSKPSECVFPFTYKGETFNACAEDDDGKEWCATEVDKTGAMRKGFWGWCDEKACTSDEQPVVLLDEPEPVPTAMAATLKLENQNGITADIRFEQEDENSPLNIMGKVSGLSPGLHGFHVHELADDGSNCTAAGGHYNPFNVDHAGPDDDEQHVGDFGNIEADADGVAIINLTVNHASLYGNEKNIMGRTLVIHSGEDDLGTKETDPESLRTGNAGTRVACAIIAEVADEWNLTLLIIIILVVVIVALVLLICCLCLCCCLKKKRDKKRLDDPDFAYVNGDMKKKPLYDELSIPFIDASPAPTPKNGRSTERLSFFHRSSSIGRSRGSLSGEGQI